MTAFLKDYEMLVNAQVLVERAVSRVTDDDSYKHNLGLTIHIAKMVTIVAFRGLVACFFEICFLILKFICMFRLEESSSDYGNFNALVASLQRVVSQLRRDLSVIGVETMDVYEQFKGMLAEKKEQMKAKTLSQAVVEYK